MGASNCPLLPTGIESHAGPCEVLIRFLLRQSRRVYCDIVEQHELVNAVDQIEIPFQGI